MRQQIVTFEELFPHVARDGVYFAEDLHTSYWWEYGGGYRQPDTFIEYAKNFIDDIHAWHARPPKRKKWYRRLLSSLSPPPAQLAVTEFTRSAHSLHFYGSVLVIEKQPIEHPSSLRTGIDAQSSQPLSTEG